MPAQTCSITVDNTYDNIDNVVEVHNQHEEDYEPEETYIIPNCPPASGEESNQSATATRSSQQGGEDDKPEGDERLSLAESVISGDADKVCLILRRRPELIFAVVASDQTAGSDCLNLFDLAVKHKQCEVLQTLLREAARNNNDHLETFLAKTDSLSDWELINEVIKQNSKTGAKLLNNCINLNSDEQFVNINLNNFVASKLPETVLCHGSSHLLDHPVNLCATYLKWSRYRHYVFTFLALNIIFSILLSASVTVQTYQSSSLASTVLLILSCIVYLPILILNSWVLLNTNRALVSYLKISLNISHLFLFIIFIIISFCQLNTYFIHHIMAWTVLLSWLRILIDIHDIPETSFYVQIFINVFNDIIKFILLLLVVLLGFSFSFHSVLNVNLSREKSPASPVDSFIKVLAMMAGEFDVNSNLSESLIEIQGSAQIIFILCLLLVSLVMMNITLGLTVTTLQRTFSLKSQYKLIRMMIINYKIEQILRKIKKIKRRFNLSKYRCFLNVLEPFSSREIFLKINEEKKEKNPTLLSSLTEGPRASFSKVYTRNSVTQDIEPSTQTICQKIVEDCLCILESRRIKIEEELAAEATKCQEEAEGYTSLYDDNQYEEIQPEVKFEGLRSVKELLLKELKRDLLKLIKLDKVYSEVKKKPAKSVNVRPGLALGVITLQAGARGVQQFNIENNAT